MLLLMPPISTNDRPKYGLESLCSSTEEVNRYIYDVTHHDKFTSFSIRDIS